MTPESCTNLLITSPHPRKSNHGQSTRTMKVWQMSSLLTFEDKILQIRKVLETTPPYMAEQQAVPRLTRLAPMTEEEVHKVIVSLITKSCELDTMPTDILKKMMPVVLPLITKIVNHSLTQGDFCRSWKTAVVQPLLKKLGLQLIHSNYRPVSNLTFISKVIERCMLLQLSQHCTSHNLQPGLSICLQRALLL